MDRRGRSIFIVAVAVEGVLVVGAVGLLLKAVGPSAGCAPSSRRPRSSARRNAAAAASDAGRGRQGHVRDRDRVREKGWGGAIRSSINDLAGWAQVEQPDLVRLAGPDGSMSILFSDIEGSTELNERLGDKQWVRLLARHDATVRSAVERQQGHVVKTQGDGFMVAFTEPVQAVRTAVAVQQAFEKGRRGARRRS